MKYSFAHCLYNRFGHNYIERVSLYVSPHVNLALICHIYVHFSFESAFRLFCVMFRFSLFRVHLLFELKRNVIFPAD